MVHGYDIREDKILSQILQDAQDAETEYNNNHSGENVKIKVVYEMEITKFNTTGYVSSIKFKNRKFITEDL